MAGDAYGAIVAKRQLASRLAAMRTRTGMSLNEVSDKLAWKRGRLDRYERNEWRLPDASHVRDLARIYKVSDSERAELEDLCRLANERVWWRSYEDVFGKGNEFAGFENDAARISVYMPLILPGLLQTREYMQAMLRVGPWPEKWRERALLAAMSRRPGIELRMLRFAGGPHPGMSSVINIFDFPDDEDPSVVYLENDTAMQEVTKAEEVRAYKQTFAQVRDAALTPTATRTHLDHLTQPTE